MANQSEIRKVEQYDGDCGTTDKPGDADRMGRAYRVNGRGRVTNREGGRRRLIEDGAMQPTTNPTAVWGHDTYHERPGKLIKVGRRCPSRRWHRNHSAPYSAIPSKPTKRTQWYSRVNRVMVTVIPRLYFGLSNRRNKAIGILGGMDRLCGASLIPSPDEKRRNEAIGIMGNLDRMYQPFRFYSPRDEPEGFRSWLFRTPGNTDTMTNVRAPKNALLRSWLYGARV
jgi:hypothetical protein